MKMLVADSGGTHTVWVLCDTQTTRVLETVGLNPHITKADQAERILATQVRAWVGDTRLGGLYYFGAGLGSVASKRLMTDLLKQHLTPAVQVFTDQEGAALACLGKRAGVVGILGTGSVAFAYNGAKITGRRGGLGYKLGDEGGGISLGRSFLRALLNGAFNERINTAYQAFSGLDPAQLREHFYNHRRPASFLADQAPFLDRFRDDPQIADILARQFGFFICNDLLPLMDSPHDQVVFCGGVARHFAHLLKEMGGRYGLDRISVLEEIPAKGIVRYLQEHQFPTLSFGAP